MYFVLLHHTARIAYVFPIRHPHRPSPPLKVPSMRILVFALSVVLIRGLIAVAMAFLEASRMLNPMAWSEGGPQVLLLAISVCLAFPLSRIFTRPKAAPAAVPQGGVKQDAQRPWLKG